MKIKPKEKREIFCNTFIEYCKEEISKQQKLVAGVHVLDEPSHIEKILSSCSRIPIIGSAANMIILVDQLWRNVYEQGATERITRIFSAHSQLEIDQMLSQAIQDIINRFKNTLNDTNNRQEIINFAALAKNKLFIYLRTNHSIKTLTPELIIEIIQQQNSWFKSDAFSTLAKIQENIEQTQNHADSPLEPMLKRRKVSTEIDASELDDDSEANVLQLGQAFQEPHGLAETALKTHYFYNVPEPVHCFAGRIEQLNIIHQYLSQNNNGVQVIGGLGGIGKTQITLKYIKEHKLEYEYRVRWIIAENKEMLDSYFSQFAHELEINIDNKNNDEILKLVKKTLESQIDHSLLVFDNVVDFELINQYLPNPGGFKQHHVIITTQNTKDPEDSSSFTGMNVIKLEAFAQEEALALITASLDSFNEQDGLKLIELFDSIPLGLAQSASYIKNHGINIKTYLDMHQKFKDEHPTQLFAEDLDLERLNSHKNNIYVTISMSIEQLSITQPKAFELLKLCSYLYSDNIPDYLFNNIFTGIIEMSGTITILQGYSLISVRSEGDIKLFSIHRLLQEVIRCKMIDDGSITMQRVMEFLHKQIVAEDSTSLFFKKNQLLLSHACILLEHYNLIKNDATTELNKKAAELYNDCGNIYFILLQLDVAQEKYQQALELYKSIYHDERHQKIATIINNIGAVHQALGQSVKALESYQRILSIYKELYDDQPHQKVAITMSKIGYLYLTVQNIEEALAQYNQALTIFKELKDDHNIADTLSSIGYVYRVAQRYDEALEQYAQASIISAQLYGGQSSQIAEIEHAMGKLYLFAHKNEEALGHFNNALIINENIYGNNHYIVASNIRGIAKVQQACGNFQEAIVLYKKVMEIFQNTFGNEHFLVANAMCAIGNISQMQKQYHEALLSYNQALKIYEAVYGPDSYNVARILSNIGNIYNEIEDPQRASEHLQRSQSITKGQIPVLNQASQMSDLSWLDLVEDIEESQPSQPSTQDAILSQSCPSNTPTNSQIIYHLTEIRYDNPLLNSEMILVARKIGIPNIKIFNYFNQLGEDKIVADIIIDASYEYGAEHIVKIIFAEYIINEKTVFENKLPNINQQTSPQFNHLTVAALAIKDSIEALPILKYFFSDILYLPFSLPKIIDNNYVKITMHYAACNIGSYFLTGKVDFINSAASTAIYSSKIFLYDYLANQKQQDKITIDTPFQFIEMCSFDITTQSIISILGSLIYGIPNSYDIVISATVGGLQCYNLHNRPEKPIQDSNIAISTPYAVDLITLYLMIKNVNFDLTSGIGQMLAVKQSINIINAVVIADHVTKLIISNFNENYFDYLNDFLGEIHDYFYQVYEL